MSIWTKELSALVEEAWRAGETALDIARRLKRGLTRSAILGRMKRLGIKQGAVTAPPAHALGFNSRFGRKDRFIFSVDADRAIIRDINAGHSTEAEIADRVGCNPNQVHTRIEWLRKAGHLPAAGKIKKAAARTGNTKGGNWAFRSGAANYHPTKVVAWRDKGPDPMAPPPGLDDRGARYSILSIKDGKCRWPHGDPAVAGFHLCGNANKSGSSYCPYHTDKATVRTAQPISDQEAA